MRGIWGVPLALTLVLGCTNLNYQKTWKFPPPPETLTQTGAELHMVDARPKWELKPFRDAMSLYAVSDINPSPWDELRSMVGTVVAESPEKAERIDIVVRSIQLVTKDSNRLAQETEDRRLKASEPDTEEGFGTILVILTFGLVWEVFMSMPFEKRYPAALSQSPEGSSCTIRADVTVTWAGGKKKTIPLACGAVAASASEPAAARAVLSEAVQLTMLQVQQQLRHGLGVPLNP